MVNTIEVRKQDLCGVLELREGRRELVRVANDGCGGRARRHMTLPAPKVPEFVDQESQRET